MQTADRNNRRSRRRQRRHDGLTRRLRVGRRQLRQDLLHTEPVIHCGVDAAQFATEMRCKRRHDDIAHALLHRLCRGIDECCRERIENRLGTDGMLAIRKRLAFEQRAKPDRDCAARVDSNASLDGIGEAAQRRRRRTGLDRRRIGHRPCEQALFEQIAEDAPEVLFHRASMLTQQQHGIEQEALALRVPGTFRRKRLAGQFLTDPFERPRHDSGSPSEDELAAVTEQLVAVAGVDPTVVTALGDDLAGELP